MFTKIVAFSIALVPFFCWVGWDDGIRTPKEIASVISLGVIIVAGFSLFSIKKAFNRWFYYFLGWGLVTLLLSSYNIPVYTKTGIIGLPSTLIAYKSLLYAFLAVLSIQAIYSSDINFKLIAKTVAIVCIVMCSYCILQLVGLDEWFRTADPGTGWVGASIWDNLINNRIDPNDFGHYSRRVVGTLGNPSILAIFLSLCIPICLSLKNKLGYVATGLSLLIIGITLSLTAYIVVILSLLFILFFKNQRLAVIVSILLVLLSVYVIRLPKIQFMFNPTGRIEMLKESFNLMNKKAITGYGLGSFEYLVGMNPEVASRLHNQNWREMHCEYGQLWFEVGLIGLGLILMGLFTLFKSFLRNIQEDSIYLMASFVALLFICITYFPMRISPLSLYGIVILGLLTNKIGEGKC